VAGAISAATGRFLALPPKLRGVIYMALSTFCFAAMILFVRVASAKFSAFEIAFWRALFGLALMIPWLVRTRLAGVRTKRLKFHILRNAIHVGGVTLWFYAVSRMNLTEAMALQFTVPLFTMLLAVVFLGERLDGMRWAATAVGFFGVLVILRPGWIDISLAALTVLASSCLYGFTNFATKLLSTTESGNTVVFYMNVVHLPFTLLGAVFFWVTPALADLPWLAGVGLAAYGAHFFLTAAFRNADATVVMPVDFIKLPVMAVLAFTFLGEVPDIWSWIGGAVIFAATYFNLRRGAVGRPRPGG
jgi:drug/metabolite transporter (DMT)-like permease